MADVVIVGAGPAGCAAAIWAAVHGLSVYLVERPRGTFVQPGECLHPGAEVPLRQLGVLDQVLDQCEVGPCVRHTSINGTSASQPFGRDESGPWRALHVLRGDLEAILLRRALELGVTLCEASSVKLRTLNDVTTVVDLGSDSLKARYVIDASGRAGWLTRSLGLKPVVASPRLTAFYAYFEGRTPEEQLFEADGNGWNWTAQIADGLVNWTVLRFGIHVAPAVPQRLAAMQLRNRVRGADVTWRIAPNLAGTAHFLIGDAAFVTDPASGNGLFRAIVSGIKAAHLVATVLRGSESPVAAALYYRRWTTNWFDAETKRLSDLYAALEPDWRGHSYSMTISPNEANSRFASSSFNRKSEPERA